MFSLPWALRVIPQRLRKPISSITFGARSSIRERLSLEPGFTLQTSRVENYDTIASWENQELTVGLMFAKGDVIPGQVVVAVVDGKDVPCQLNHQNLWPDGSLRTATAAWHMPSILSGQAKDVVWTRRNGTWNNTPKHTATTAITGKVNLEYAFTVMEGAQFGSNPYRGARAKVFPFR